MHDVRRQRRLEDPLDRLSLACRSIQSAMNNSLATTVALLIAVVMTIAFVTQIPLVSYGTAPEFIVQWVPSLGVELAFRLDGLSLLFSLLISGIGIIVVLYSAAYFKSHRDLGRLQWLLLAFMLSMLGLVTADNVILLFVFWELTTITSFLLVGFNHENAKARRSAMQALIITGAGGLALLVGLIMLAEVAGSYRLSGIIAAGDVITSSSSYVPILLLILTGAFTKSAQFPFHFWLPNAMAAPSPVSAYLHSATMVKAGIYLLARLQPSLADTDLWFFTLTTVGAITAVWASLMALRQTDLKLMLAWTTVMALGTLTMFLASDTRITVLAAMTFLLVHAFYKCALFLVIGNIDKATGTREIHQLGGLIRVMPVTALAAIAAAFSMAGFPPFLGFIGKELKYEGALAIADEPFLIAAAAISANAMMVAIALAVVFRVFLGRGKQSPRPGKEVSPFMWFGPILLAAAGLLTGIFPELISKSLLQPAVSSIRAQQEIVKLSLWHGINVPLMLSILTVAIGTVLFWKATRVRALIVALVSRLPATGDTSYAGALSETQKFARNLTDRLQTGSLSQYLTIIFLVFIIATGLTLVSTGFPISVPEPTAIPPMALVIVIIMAIATIVVALSDSRLLSICSLGIIGSGLAVLFLIFGAIDVAITQLMVETLFVVLIAAVLQRLPAFPGKAHPGRAGRLRDASIAIGAGLIMGIITIGVSGTSLDLSITNFYEQASLAEAYGRNIVNVILVDFRALDTLGEIAVVATAALAVIALLKIRPAGTEASPLSAISPDPTDDTGHAASSLSTGAPS